MLYEPFLPLVALVKLFITATEMKLGGQVLGTIWVYNPPGDGLDYFTSKPSLHLPM